jgi:hypothetical protein
MLAVATFLDASYENFGWGGALAEMIAPPPVRIIEVCGHGNESVAGDRVYHPAYALREQSKLTNLNLPVQMKR